VVGLIDPALLPLEEADFVFQGKGKVLEELALVLAVVEMAELDPYVGLVLVPQEEGGEDLGKRCFGFLLN